MPLYQGWALLEMREGNQQSARKLITEALTRNKKNGHSWLVAAEIEETGGNFGLVNLLLRRGIEVSKTCYRVQRLLFSSFLLIKQQITSQCAPDDAELYRKLGEHLVGRGKFNDVRSVLKFCRII